MGGRRPGDDYLQAPPLERPLVMRCQGAQSHLFEVAIEVMVPEEVMPGDPFLLLTGGVPVLATCPEHCENEGRKIVLNIPNGLVNCADDGPRRKLVEVDGWTRAIRASDRKFEWTSWKDMLVNNGTSIKFDPERIAYVLKLDFDDGGDNGMLQGKVSLVTPSEGGFDPMIKGANGQELVNCSDIAIVQSKDYPAKVQWFKTVCAKLCGQYIEGHILLNVSRENLLSESVEAVMSLSKEELLKEWGVKLRYEGGSGEGGLSQLWLEMETHEWFELVTKVVFDPKLGLWQPSSADETCIQINPLSGESYFCVAFAA